jgi:hypothetical protein
MPEARQWAAELVRLLKSHDHLMGRIAHFGAATQNHPHQRQRDREREKQVYEACDS